MWFQLMNSTVYVNLIKLIARIISLVTANAWEEGDEVILITCRLENPDLDKVNGHQSEKLESFGNELYVYLQSEHLL